MEKTLVLIKPDAVNNHYIGAIIKHYEEAKLRVVAMKMMKMDDRLAAIHYVEHLSKPYYHELSSFMTSGPLVAMILEGEDAIKRVRKLHGKTNPADAEEGTIRKEFAENGRHNAVHASDSPESVAREIPIFFSEAEVFDGEYEILG